MKDNEVRQGIVNADNNEKRKYIFLDIPDVVNALDAMSMISIHESMITPHPDMVDIYLLVAAKYRLAANIVNQMPKPGTIERGCIEMAAIEIKMEIES